MTVSPTARRVRLGVLDAAAVLPAGAVGCPAAVRRRAGGVSKSPAGRVLIPLTFGLKCSDGGELYHTY